MHCLVWRHAPAEDSSPDAARVLTARGARRAQRLAGVLATAVPTLRTVAASPLVRAQHTAAPLAAHLGVDLLTLDALRPGQWRGLWPWLAGAPDAVALVGHAPDLDAFIAAALVRRTRPFTALRKGGAALLEFRGAPGPGSAQLVWLAPARLLLGLNRP